MNFDLTEEQQMLSDTARDVLGRSYDTESRNKAVDSRFSSGAGPTTDRS